MVIERRSERPDRRATSAERRKQASATLIEKTWKEEVARAVDGSGLPWKVSTAWIEQRSRLCCADLTDTRNGNECRVSLAGDRFATTAARRVEIARQLTTCAKR